MKHGLVLIRSLLAYALVFLFVSGCSQSSGEGVSETSTNTFTPPPAPTPSPIHFLSEQGKFEITFPYPEATQTLMEYTVTKKTFGKTVECNLVLARDNGAVWLVQYCDYTSQSLAGLSTQEILNRGRDEALLDANARLESESDITFNKTIPGRELVAETDMRGMGYDGTYKARLYLAGNRLYCIAASVYNENWGNRLALMDPFLDSFLIEPDLTIPYEPSP